jgi:hypothetical protein
MAEAVGLQAVTDAFVMLGLISAPEAAAVLEEAGTAPRPRGLPDARRGARSEDADYWLLRSRGPDGLSFIPRAVAAGPVRLATESADLCVEWLRVSRADLRLQVDATAPGAGLPARHVGLALADLALADDVGTTYQMFWDGGSGTSAAWVGDVVAQPAPPDGVTWFELRALGSAERPRITLPAPLTVPTGTAAGPWPTAGEAYLALLCVSDPPAAVGPDRGRDVVAAVAEALLAVGAIPADSILLPQALGRVKRSRHPVLPTTWPSPVRRPTPPDMRIAICAALPFTAAVVVIEGLSGWGQDVQVHLYGWPWVHSKRGPTAIPSFTVRAIDDLGGEHDGRPGSWHEYGAGESRGDFTLWPAVPVQARRLRILVSTLWETAWADIELPLVAAWPW